MEPVGGELVGWFVVGDPEGEPEGAVVGISLLLLGVVGAAAGEFWAVADFEEVSGSGVVAFFLAGPLL